MNNTTSKIRNHGHANPRSADIVNSPLTLLRIPKVRGLVAGALLGAQTMPLLANSVANSAAPDLIKGQTSLSRDTAKLDNPDITPIPIGKGKVEGFGDPRSPSRSIYVFQDSEFRYAEPSWAFVERNEPISFSEGVDAKTRERLNKPAFKIVQNYSPLEVEKGSEREQRVSISFRFLSASSAPQLLQFGRAYNHAQLLNQSTGKVDPLGWRSIDVTHCKVGIVDSVSKEVLGFAQSDPIRGMSYADLTFEVSTNQAKKILSTVENGRLQAHIVYTARAAREDWGKIAQHGSMERDIRGLATNDVVKTALGGRVSLNDAQHLEEQLRIGITTAITVNNPELLPSIKAMYVPPGFILDCLEPVGPDELSNPAEKAAMASWMQAGQSSENSATTRSGWSEREENLRETSRKKHGFWGRRQTEQVRDTHSKSGESSTVSTASSSQQVLPGDVKAFKIKEQALKAVFDNVATVSIYTTYSGYLAVPPVPQQFTDTVFNNQLDSAVRQNFSNLIADQPSLSVLWISTIVQGERNDPVYQTNSLSAFHSIDASKTELSYPAKLQFHAPPEYRFESILKDNIKITPSLEGQKAQLQAVELENDGRSATLTVLFSKGSAQEQQGGFTVVLPNQRFVQDRFSDVEEIRQRIEITDKTPLSMDRSGGPITISTEKLKMETVQKAKTLLLDILVKLPPPRDSQPIRLEGRINEGQTTVIDGVNVRWKNNKLLLWIDR